MLPAHIPLSQHSAYTSFIYSAYTPFNHSAYITTKSSSAAAGQPFKTRRAGRKMLHVGACDLSEERDVLCFWRTWYQPGSEETETSTDSGNGDDRSNVEDEQFQSQGLSFGLADCLSIVARARRRNRSNE